MDIARDGIVGLSVDETQPHEMDEPRHEMQVFASFFLFDKSNYDERIFSCLSLLSMKWENLTHIFCCEHFKYHITTVCVSMCTAPTG